MKTGLSYLLALACGLVLASTAFAQRVIPEDDNQLLYQIYKELVNTRPPHQSKTIPLR